MEKETLYQLKAEIERLKSEMDEMKKRIEKNEDNVEELEKQFIKMESSLKNISEQYKTIEFYMIDSLEYLQESNSKKETVLINSLSIKDKVFIGLFLAYIGFKEPILALFGL